MNEQFKADVYLFIVTIIWGSTFAITKSALSSLSSFNFLAIRFTIALLVSSLIFHKKFKNINLETFKYGLIIGSVLFFAYATQTIGLEYTTASKSGFITGFCVVIVPVTLAIMTKVIPEKKIVLGVILAILGLAFLSLDSELSFNLGDLLTLLGAFGYAFHIILVGKYTSKVDSTCLAIIQIGVVGILSTVFSLIFETPVVPTDLNIWIGILITAILATSLTFIVQNEMQQYTSATHAALIYSCEPVFGALFAYLLLGEVLTTKAILGCSLILLGTLIAELDFKFSSTKKDINYAFNESSLERSDDE